MRAQSWRAEGLLRMLENVLAVAEDRANYIVYAALGKACRDEKSYKIITKALENLQEDESLIIQSGKPIGIIKTHKNAPLVLMANCNILGQWAHAHYFYELEKKNLICWGGLTAGDWQYIGSQGVIQGTYEIFMQIARKYFNNTLKHRFILTAGCGGMGGSQGLAGFMAQAATLLIDCDETKLIKRTNNGYLQKYFTNLQEALDAVLEAKEKGEALSVGLLANASEAYPAILKKGIIPDIVTDQTSAHDLIYGYIPYGYSLDEIQKLREQNPKELEAQNLACIKRHVLAMLEFQKRGSVVFDNGNLIRTQAKKSGVENAFDIPIFTEAFLRDLFCQGIGPFRWVALSGDEEDIHFIDRLLLDKFKNDERIVNWIKLASKHIPFEGLPARIAWLGHGQRSKLALEVNDLVKNKKLKAPIAFTRDHLDAGAMAHPHIMTQNMKDGSDAISDWPLLNALITSSSGADLVAIHSGGGGYSGFMTSAGVTIIADGSEEASERIKNTMDNDTASGIFRYADAGYELAKESVIRHKLNYLWS